MVASARIRSQTSTGDYVNRAWISLQEFIKNGWRAFWNAIIWSLVWFVSFTAAIFAIPKLSEGGIEFDETSMISSALALTVAVFSGHVPKLLAYLLSSNSDFHNMKIGAIKFGFLMRLIFGGTMLIFSIIYLFDVEPEIITKPFEWFSEGHIDLSIILWRSILLLFLAQMIFSWPEPVRHNITAQR